MKVIFLVEIYVTAPSGGITNRLGGVFTKEVEMTFCPSVGTIIDLDGSPFGFVVSHARWSEGKPCTVVHLERPAEGNCRKFLEKIDELRKLGWK